MSKSYECWCCFGLKTKNAVYKWQLITLPWTSLIKKNKGADGTQRLISFYNKLEFSNAHCKLLKRRNYVSKFTYNLVTA